MVLIVGMFYIEIIIVSSRNGDQVLKICLLLYVGVVGFVFVVLIVVVDFCLLVNWNVVFGFYYFKNIVSVVIEISVDKIFGSLGFKKLELRY